MKKSLALGVVLATGLTLVNAGLAHAASQTILVPDDFVSALSDTRATGHYQVDGTALHLWTESNTSTDKVAEYVATNKSLTTAGEPNLDFDNTSGGGVPGFQLVIDFDGNTTADGILVGEPVYNGDWWANNGSAQFVRDGAPSHTGGSGSANHGTLDEWRTAFPAAQILYFGFSLGSGVKGDGYLRAINFAGDSYAFGLPDHTPPTVTCDVAAPGPQFVQSQSASVTATVTDSGSGPLTPTVSAPADTATLGAKTVQLTGQDVAGNEATATCSYSVVVGAAAVISPVSGSGQSAIVGTQFAQPLQVKVTDAYGNPTEGATVTFAAPATGASGSFPGGATAVTDSSGIAAAYVTANSKTGSWQATASTAGVSGSAQFSLTNIPAPPKRADLQVSLTGPTQLAKGQTATYTLTVKNLGPDTATDVIASLGLPNGAVKIVSVSGSYVKAGCAIIWAKVPSLAKNASVTYTVKVTATKKGSWTLLGGAASLKVGDPVLKNNFASLKLKIS